MKKSVYIFYAFNLFCFLSFSQDFKWANTDTRSGYLNKATHVATDKNFNSYIAGDYGGCHSMSCYGFFLAKYDSSGYKLWSKYFDGTGGIIKSLFVDSIGNIYISIAADYLTIDTITYNQKNGLFFMIKYDTYGNTKWIRQSHAPSIFDKLSADGSLIVTGEFADTLKLSSSIALITNHNLGSQYIAKYDTGGNCNWAIQNDGGHYKIACAKTKDIFVYGSVWDTLKLGQGTNQVIFYHKDGYYYIAKYDSSANLQWARQLKSGPTNMTTDNNGNLYFISSMLWEVTFGNFTFSDTGNYSTDVIFVKYDKNGNCPWAKRFIGKGKDVGSGIACANDGSIYISGSFDDDMHTGDTILYANGNTRMFVAKYDTSGTRHWITSTSGQGGALGRAISLDQNKGIYITGDLGGGQVIFGNCSATNQIGFFICKVIDEEIINANVSIEQKVSNSSLIIYPNPSSGIFTINYTSQEKRNLEVKITNVKGQTIFTESISHFTGEYTKDMDLSKYAKGIYFVEIIADRKRTIRKLVLD